MGHNKTSTCVSGIKRYMYIGSVAIYLYFFLTFVHTFFNLNFELFFWSAIEGAMNDPKKLRGDVIF